ncbi:TPA: hypothetical protein QCH54_003017 [Enterobacter ludwigii]|jgi:uncharacterized protein YdhG (YjbR/CyaY superfamily)|uniref:hypothetical protein n=1 Tax=Enterobacter cloacae complex TaxID=354276 RepID=UPI00123C08B2|nr:MULTISPECIES: hypothetical protein [Enterobacter cloacae complex]ELT3966505.1 hypothetical protein [Enterobacter hormaechei subsp. steigerwaltii]ELX8342964.1 hypothetical protein [Enterobacter hormaechei]CAF3139757.1 hypothetical protein AI2983V1_2783 [Enterobacter cloacae]ELZ2866358.1 hypothetical protein [Enterobacter hormaechei]WFX56947.1 hypothetical protein NFK08_14315 [Enterobacter roggenkampii]
MEALPLQVTLYIHASTNPHAPAIYPVATCDMSQNYPELYVLLETRTIRLEINQPEPIDIIGKQVERLQKEKASIVDQAHQRVAFIEDKIQQLLCIDHSTIQESDIPF